MRPIACAARNLRSAVARNALLALGDAFFAIRQKLSSSGLPQCLEPAIEPLLLQGASDKRFLCQAAETSLAILCETFCSRDTVQVLLAFHEHKRPAVQGKAAHFAAQCIRTMTRANLIEEYQVSEEGTLMKSHVALFSRLLSAKSTLGRKGAAQALRCIKEHIGMAKMVSIIESSCRASDVSAAKKAVGCAKHRRGRGLSLRERMRQQRQKQKQGRRSQQDSGSVVVFG